MTHEEFDKLVLKVEGETGKDTRTLRRRLLLLVCIGYAGLLAGVFVVLAIAALFIVPSFFIAAPNSFILLGIGCFVALIGMAAVLRVLLVQLPPPTGRVVTAKEAPALFRLLEELQQNLRAPKFDTVMVTPVCNAAVAQRPRLGVFGWSRNYLLLGLPLLDGLTADEMKSVLAHEFAHLSGQHGRFDQWIYRLRRSWDEVFQKMSQPRFEGEISLRPLIAKFIQWFWPRFNAHAFVLSRANEYYADSVAAQQTTPLSLGSALVHLVIYNRHLADKFWPECWQLAAQEPKPAAGLFLRIRQTLHDGYESEHTETWIKDALKVVTTNADTHPCLKDRLQALGCQNIFRNNLADRIKHNAAEEFFGAALAVIRPDVEKHWWSEVEKDWTARYAKANSLQHRLGRIETVAPARTADVDLLWDKARVILELKGDDTGEPLLQEILALDRNHALANFHLGRLLLERADPRGETHLDQAIIACEELTTGAATLLHDYFRRTGALAKIKELNFRMDQYEKALQASRQERSSVSARDKLIPHDLTPDELQGFLATVSGESDLMEVYIARKELKHFPAQKLFVVCIRARRTCFGLVGADREEAIVNRLGLKAPLPGRAFFFAAGGDFSKLGKKVRHMPGSKVFNRPGQIPLAFRP